MIMKLCMEQYLLKLYKVYINDDPKLILTHFKTKIKFGETCFCTYSRPRYQVSVYRTIGPLVLSVIWDASSENLVFAYAKIKARFVSDLVGNPKTGFLATRIELLWCIKLRIRFLRIFNQNEPNVLTLTLILICPDSVW